MTTPSETSLPEQPVLDGLTTAACNICGARGEFSGPAGHLDGLTVPENYNYREGLQCAACGSISRDRAVMYVLSRLLRETAPLEEWRARGEMRLLETSGYRGHPPRLARLFDYFNTHFLPPTDLPEVIDGRTTANLEDLPYPDAFFDIILCAEVLEHVSRIELAVPELYRVLDPDGFAVITVPYVHGWRRTSTRVQRWHDRDVHLYPAEYHADETLVYRIYGRDFLTQLRDAGFGVAFVTVTDPTAAISETDVIIASRAPFVDISGFLPHPGAGA
jgi:SAM-dependent methyltransferase